MGLNPCSLTVFTFFPIQCCLLGSQKNINCVRWWEDILKIQILLIKWYTVVKDCVEKWKWVGLIVISVNMSKISFLVFSVILFRIAIKVACSLKIHWNSHCFLCLYIHCIYTAYIHHIYPFIYRWTLGLLP